MSGERQNPSAPASRAERRRFTHIAAAGITFQAGSAAVDSATIMAALVHQLTGNPLAVGAVAAVLRFGWLFPQLFVGYLAERRASSMGYYMIGGFGRALCLLILAAVLHVGTGLSSGTLAVLVLLLWTAYAFVSGIVAVPYNDIVARAVTSDRRSRLLALRFFGGGVLALCTAAAADTMVDRLPFPASYGAIVALAGGFMLVSSVLFVVMGEPDGAPPATRSSGFAKYLREGARTFRSDRRFRMFVFAQWASGGVLLALPFYVVGAFDLGFDVADVAWLLGAQTAGAIVSNPLWGWWGDRLGKSSLLQAVASVRMLPPGLAMALIFADGVPGHLLFATSLCLFFVIGALANGLTIAVVGYLMEISPAKSRPSYSGYFNALTAPAYLFPLLGGAIASFAGLLTVFALSLIAAGIQTACVARLRGLAGDRAAGN